MTDQASWWKRGVIYQIYPRSWADSNGDGIGDLPGIIDRLDYLVDTLPVDAIWLSPFFPSPQADFGYDVADFCDVDPMYGTLEDMDRLIAEAHARGLRVIIDYVINHSSDQHPWFLESRASIGSPKRDWYVWRDPKPDGSPPNNWVSAFGGPAWTFDQASGQFYLHSFLSEQPDFNWRNPEVERAMFGVLSFWMDRGVDGFRIDVAHRAMKDPLLRDNPPVPELPADAYKLEPEYASQLHIHDMAHPDIHPLFRRLRSLVDGHDQHVERFTVGEIHEYGWQRWASYYGAANDELHMPFNFSLLPAGVQPERIRRAVTGVEAALPPGAWPNWVIGNHDEPRVATRLGWEQSKAAAVMLLTLRGTPTLYYGDEIGIPDADIPPEEQQDPWGRRKPGFGRDGCRTPMQWTSGEHAGFSPPGTASTWLPVAQQDTISVEAELDRPGSHLWLHRRLLHLRRARPALQLGDITLLGSSPNPLVYRRSLEGHDPVWVALNLSPDEAEVGVGEVEGCQVLLSTDPERVGARLDKSSRLAPWEGVIVC